MRRLLIIVVGLLLISVFLFIPYLTKDVVTIKVTDKERIVTGSGESMESKYLVYTENETFENVDATNFLKFNSSDLQGKLKRDSVYKVMVYGYRIPFLSSYRNIVKIVE